MIEIGLHCGQVRGTGEEKRKKIIDEMKRGKRRGKENRKTVRIKTMRGRVKGNTGDTKRREEDKDE